MDSEDFDAAFDAAFEVDESEEYNEGSADLISYERGENARRKLESALPDGGNRGGEGGAGDLLTSRPREVILRILSFLSAEDLQTAGQACQTLNQCCGESVLWRRLFCARWGKPKEPESQERVCSWKLKYHEADAEEFHQTVWAAPQELRSVFSQMQMAKRQQSLGLAAVDDTAKLPVCQVQRQIADWRRERGFVATAVEKPNLSTAAFHHLSSDAYVCEATGWAHLCGPSCPEGIVDSDSGLITCPISGRTSLPALMSRHEERRMQQLSVDACFAAADQEMQQFSAARAYREGYYADAKEMKRKYGVCLR